MLQVCHGGLADPDCGVSTEVLMNLPETQVCIARRLVQSLTPSGPNMKMCLFVLKCLQSGALMQGAGATLSASSLCVALTGFELWIV